MASQAAEYVHAVASHVAAVRRNADVAAEALAAVRRRRPLIANAARLLDALAERCPTAPEAGEARIVAERLRGCAPNGGGVR